MKDKGLIFEFKTFKEEAKKEFVSVKKEIYDLRRETKQEFTLLREEVNQRFRVVTERIEDTNKRLDQTNHKLDVLTEEVKQGFAFLPKMLEAHEDWLQNHEVRIQKLEKIA